MPILGLVTGVDDVPILMPIPHTAAEMEHKGVNCISLQELSREPEWAELLPIIRQRFPSITHVIKGPTERCIFAFNRLSKSVE